ncbi:MAG: TetR/AcrR family transcriptional regulator [Anaerolineales bacterium]|nr:MAG: TetR/AcrR family transcriptional regulator [Anaerolineales bacterium]
MAPRKYTKTKREAASEAIRQRIIQSTLALHSQKGIFGTSWKDIAKHADVSLATMYNYFPSLDELVPACGELMYAIAQPPSLDDAHAMFANAATVEQRVASLVKNLLDFYERGEPYLDIDHQERILQSVQEWEAYLKSLIEGLTRMALKPIKPNKRTVETVSALLDVPVFLSFRRKGMTRVEIERMMNDLLLCLVVRSPG